MNRRGPDAASAIRRKVVSAVMRWLALLLRLSSGRLAEPDRRAGGLRGHACPRPAHGPATTRPAAARSAERRSHQDAGDDEGRSREPPHRAPVAFDPHDGPRPG